MKPKLVLIGGGGHAKACIDVIELEGRYSIHGILDNFKDVGSEVLGYKVLGKDDSVSEFVNQDYHFLICIGQIKNAESRRIIYQKLITANASIASIISPLAYVSKYGQIGQGTIIMNGAKVGPDVKVAENCIINTNANIEHDTEVGAHTHISTCAVLNGSCKIGMKSFIGSGTVVQQGIVISDHVIVGSRSLVRKDIPFPGTYAGDPLRRIY